MGHASEKEMVTGDSSLAFDSASPYCGMGPLPNPSTTPTNIFASLSRFRNRLGNGMNEIIPNLYLGSLRDAVDLAQLRKNRIQCIVSVHDLSASHPVHEHLELEVLRIRLSDCSSVDISTHFSTTNHFIHGARLKQTAVLVHCLAGVSRSAAIVAAYLITVCDLTFCNALTFISKKRPVVNPNFGFRMQLCSFAERTSVFERQRLREHFGTTAFEAQFAEDRAAICSEDPAAICSKNELQCTNSPSRHTSTSAPVFVDNLGEVHNTYYSADRTELLSRRNGESAISSNLPEPPIRKVIAKTLPLPEVRMVKLSTIPHNSLVPEIGYMDE